MKAQTKPISPAVIMAGEKAFQTALARARAAGGPVDEIDALACRPPAAPSLFTYRLSRYTLGIDRLLQKRAAMPGGVSAMEMLLYFTRGQEVAGHLLKYDEEVQRWPDDAARIATEELLSEATHLADALDLAAGTTIVKWINTELDEFHRLSSTPDTDLRASAGADGSRVGWWLRTAEAIIYRFGSTAPTGADLLTWALWVFPVNDYLALNPAALEREGVELPEHYAVTAARKARSRAKREACAAADAARADKAAALTDAAATPPLPTLPED